VTADKRRYERHPAAIEVVIQSEGRTIAGRSRDISLGGMFVETTAALPYGTRVSLELKLPALAATAVIDATVRWTGKDGMGVQFGSLRARETWAINQLVRR
jgi:uncharacterized protein (TIGR02266 family)